MNTREGIGTPCALYCTPPRLASGCSLRPGHEERSPLLRCLIESRWVQVVGLTPTATLTFDVKSAERQ